MANIYWYPALNITNIPPNRVLLDLVDTKVIDYLEFWYILAKLNSLRDGIVITTKNIWMTASELRMTDENCAELQYSKLQNLLAKRTNEV